MGEMVVVQIQDFLLIRRADNLESLLIDLRDGEVLGNGSDKSVLLEALLGLATYITAEHK